MDQLQETKYGKIDRKFRFESCVLVVVLHHKIDPVFCRMKKETETQLEWSGTQMQRANIEN